MNATAFPDRPPAHAAPLALWRVAAAFMHTLHVLFGAPGDVADRRALTARAYRQMAAWLACAEALLRHLLLIEARALPRPPAPAPRRQRARPRQAHVNMGETETWRVSFRCFAGAACKRHAARRRPPWRFRAAWPLAARYEALLRVFNQPWSYAKRLARRLAHAPQRAADLLRAPPEAVHRIAGYGALKHHATRAERRFNSS